jgi:uncharacterized membrane protein YfcA
MEMLWLGIVVAGAAFFRGVTGYGFALLAALGLTLVLPPQTATPLIVLIDLFITALILRTFKAADVDWKASSILLGFGLVGAVFGPFASEHMSPGMAQLATSATVGIAALVAMVRHPPRWAGSTVTGALAAFVTGMVVTAFAVGGPLAAVWLLAGGTREDKVRSTLALFFGAIDLTGLIMRYQLGILPPGFLSWVLPGLVLALIGYLPGERLYRRLAPLTWRRFSAAGLVAIAVAGGIQTTALLIFGHAAAAPTEQEASP